MPRHVPLENEKERTSDAEAPGDGRAGHPTRPQGQGGGPKKKEQSCGECCTAWFMMLLLVVRILTVLAAALVVVAHILILVELPLGLDVWEIWARRLYGIGLCVLVMLLHVRCVGILEHWSALKNWAMRGLFYTFVGLLGLQESQQAAQRSVLVENDAKYVVAVSGWVMISIGLLYVVMGILCLKRLAVKHQRAQRERAGRRADQWV